MSVMETKQDTTTGNRLEKVQGDKPLQGSISSIKHKFIFMSSQEGVGKTSVMVNLAIALSKRKVKIGLLDANFHSPDIHKMLGLEAVFLSDSDKRFIPISYSAYLKVASIGSVIPEKEETGVWGRRMEIADIQRFIDTLSWGNLDYLLIDTPPGPGEGLLSVIRSIPDAQAIIVTAPNRIGRDQAKKMINFFNKEKIPIFGWIENMQGFLCQHCGQRHEMFSSGSGSRAIFLLEVPFLGKVPIDPYMREFAGSETTFMETFPGSQAAEAFNLIADVIMESNIVASI